MDWREIDLTTPEGLHALDREIAERLGWTNIEPVSYWEETYYDTYEVHALRGQSPGSHSDDSLLPAYSTDANAALQLVSNLPSPAIFTLQLRTNRNGEEGWRAWIDMDINRRTDIAVSPALAICVVWLDWYDFQLKRGEVDDGLA